MPATRLPLTGAPLAAPLEFQRTGMPTPDSVLEALEFTPVVGGPSYHLLRTTELDSYEASPAKDAVSHILQREHPPSVEELRAALQTRPVPTGDNFAGTARKAAKLSIAQSSPQSFADVRDLIATLPPDDAMINHVPPISTGARSTRVKEEQRNARLTGYLYAASREADNDFHLIVGRDPNQLPEMYMTMEVSGLPPATSPAFSAIRKARDAFKAFFGAHLPQLSYDFYHPPIPVVIEGALFFDMTHATGQRPGPASLKSRMPTIWEVHPVTDITLGTH